MYKGVKVLDGHGHVSAPGNGGQVVALLFACNTESELDPRTQGNNTLLGISEDSWNQAVEWHVDLLDDHNIDVQLLGPRPFLMLGWMQPHLLPFWTRFVNNMIVMQVSMELTRFVGAAMLPQNPWAPDLQGCLAETDRCAKELGFQAVYLSPDPSGDRASPGMHTSYWYPVYERCQALG